MTMNILQLEDTVKGLPDEVLMQQAQNPTGEIPQFLTISEIRRRSDMRERFQAQQDQPQGTIADQVIQKGLASMQPQGYAGGGEIQAPRWWERMLPMASPDTMYRDMSRMSQRSQPSMRDQMGGVADIRMQIADIQSQGMTPDVDEQGNPVIVWEDGKPRVVVNGQPYGYAQGGIVSLQRGGEVPDIFAMNPFFGMPYRVVSGIIQEVSDPYQSANVSERIASEPPSAPPMAPQASMPPVPTVPGGKEVQGASPIQSQAMGLGSMFSAPELPPREKIEYPSMEGQREGLAALGAETRDMYERMSEEQRGSNIDVSDLIEGGKKDAWNAAMIQIGASIARNDLAGGLEQAGQTGANAAKQARAMELWSRIQRAENDAKARELLAKGQISEREYQRAILESEASEDLGRAKFDFEQREADSLDLYRRGQAHVDALQAKLTELEILDRLTARAISGESEVPEPPEGKTMYELMEVATGLGNSLEGAIGRLRDTLGGDLPPGAKEIVDARAHIQANLQNFYSALATTRAWKEREWLAERFDITPRAGLGDDTGQENLKGLSSALETMLLQQEADASNPNITEKERESAAHTARVIRNFIPIIGAPTDDALDFIGQ